MDIPSPETHVSSLETERAIMWPKESADIGKPRIVRCKKKAIQSVWDCMALVCATVGSVRFLFASFQSLGYSPQRNGNLAHAKHVRECRAYEVAQPERVLMASHQAVGLSAYEVFLLP